MQLNPLFLPVPITVRSRQAVLSVPMSVSFLIPSFLVVEEQYIRGGVSPSEYPPYFLSLF